MMSSTLLIISAPSASLSQKLSFCSGFDVSALVFLRGPNESVLKTGAQNLGVAATVILWVIVYI